MLFNSYHYILLYLPLSIWLYWLARKKLSLRTANGFLAIQSLLFYGYWDFRAVPLIVASIAFNYFITELLNRNMGARSLVLCVGLTVDILLLCLFKYLDFFSSNINYVLGSNLPQFNWVLPLGISFFTFTQMAYLVDTYRCRVGERSIVNYSLFVLFFPHLIAGPIIHHSEMMPQFADEERRGLTWFNSSLGLHIFAIGLFKKVVIADTFAVWANAGYAGHELHLIAAWLTSLSYTFQIYFDFSGYVDMAIGSALFFHIRLPENFNSPYKAIGIQDFWSRWHMTLSRWLKEYLYIPLGGNRGSELFVARNLLLVFLLGGFWHGAGWTYVVWGALHGIALVVERNWKRVNWKMPHILAWLLTFLFVNFSWIFFRAPNLQSAFGLLSSMIGLHGVTFPADSITLAGLVNGSTWSTWLSGIKGGAQTAILLVVSLWVVTSTRNSQEMRYAPTLLRVIFTSSIIVISLFSMNGVSEFIYFTF